MRQVKNKWMAYGQKLNESCFTRDWVKWARTDNGESFPWPFPDVLDTRWVWIPKKITKSAQIFIVYWSRRVKSRTTITWLMTRASCDIFLEKRKAERASFERTSRPVSMVGNQLNLVNQKQFSPFPKSCRWPNDPSPSRNVNDVISMAVEMMMKRRMKKRTRTHQEHIHARYAALSNSSPKSSRSSRRAQPENQYVFDEKDIDPNPLPGFIDPITLEEVVKPAISPYGHVMGYDSWLRCLNSEDRKNICPITKKPLNKRELVVLTHDNIDMHRYVLEKVTSYSKWSNREQVRRVF